MDVSGIGSAADKLASIVKDATGIIIDPIRKIVLSEADLIIEKRKAIKQLEIDKINLSNRMAIRLYETEVQRQLNLETIFQDAVNNLDPSSEPDKINRDWLNYFISTSQDISENDLKLIWSKLLVEECREVGKFSKMTLDKLKVMTSKDCMLFEKLCSKVIKTRNNSLIIKILKDKSFESAYNFNFSDFIHLCDLGLINNSEIANISMPPGSSLEIILPDGRLNYIENNGEIDFLLKFYLLTSAGNELKTILEINTDELYFTNLKLSFEKTNIKIKDIHKKNNSFLHDNVD